MVSLSKKDIDQSRIQSVLNLRACSQDYEKLATYLYAFFI